MVFGLGRVDDDLSLVPLHIRPLEPNRFGRDAQPAIARQRDEQLPRRTAGPLGDAIDCLARNEALACATRK